METKRREDTEEYKIQLNAMSMLIDKEVILRELRGRLKKEKRRKLQQIHKRYQYRERILEQDIKNIARAAIAMLGKKVYNKARKARMEKMEKEAIKEQDIPVDDDSVTPNGNN